MGTQERQLGSEAQRARSTALGLIVVSISAVVGVLLVMLVLALCGKSDSFVMSESGPMRSAALALVAGMIPLVVALVIVLKIFRRPTSGHAPDYAPDHAPDHAP
ncbi:MAG TPA: hypothetical protein PKC43_14915 [Phycisphaerales bacterium]|nr:hypothetical protein [Phycisphaerales bacterium]HMP38725.1 hypothetical protein [Phycisphaerales bacterium]